MPTFIDSAIQTARSWFSELSTGLCEGEIWTIFLTLVLALLEVSQGELELPLTHPSSLAILSPLPPLGGPLPSLSLKSRPIKETVCFVSFVHRRRASGGAFYDYTTRYGAVRLTVQRVRPHSGAVKTSVEDSLIQYVC
jgi:hypothetical protein